MEIQQGLAGDMPATGRALRALKRAYNGTKLVKSENFKYYNPSDCNRVVWDSFLIRYVPILV